MESHIATSSLSPAETGRRRFLAKLTCLDPLWRQQCHILEATILYRRGTLTSDGCTLQASSAYMESRHSALGMITRRLKSSMTSFMAMSKSLRLWRSKIMSSNGIRSHALRLARTSNSCEIRHCSLTLLVEWWSHKSHPAAGQLIANLKSDSSNADFDRNDVGAPPVDFLVSFCGSIALIVDLTKDTRRLLHTTLPNDDQNYRLAATQKQSRLLVNLVSRTQIHRQTQTEVVWSAPQRMALRRLRNTIFRYKKWRQSGFVRRTAEKLSSYYLEQC